MGLPDEPEAMGGSLQVGWPTGAAVVVVRQRQALPFAECPCCDPEISGNGLRTGAGHCYLFRRLPPGLGRDRDGTDPHPPLQGVLPLHTEKVRFNQGGICDFTL